jgi:hypothetical protein
MPWRPAHWIIVLAPVILTEGLTAGLPALLPQSFVPAFALFS